MKYDELQYALSSVKVNVAIERALSVLEDLAKLDVGCLFYAIQPSNVLALAGLRSESPYNEFEPNFSAERQSLLKNVLKSHGLSILSESLPDNEEKRNLFSIICHSAFKELPERYKAIRPIWEELLQYDNLSKFVDWSMNFETSLLEMMNKNKLPKMWLADPGAPHNIRFGMLLGYPGQAVSSVCWLESEGIKKGEPKKQLTAVLPFQGLYSGAHVNYDYVSELEGNPVLRKHQALWADVLKGVYLVFSNKRLSLVPEFNKEHDAFRKYDESI